MFPPPSSVPVFCPPLVGSLAVSFSPDRSPLPNRALHSRRTGGETLVHYSGRMFSVSFVGFSILFLFFCSSFLPCVSSADSPSPSPSPPPLPPPPSRAIVPVFAGAHPSESEVRALLSLKASWLDPSNNLASWSSSSDISVCEWKGVSCRSDNTTIISLSLPNSDLSGNLPASIAHLSSLLTLNLEFNQLSGSIPKELSSLTSVKFLRLRHNLFDGSIPESIFTLTSLQHLLLENNTLTGILSSSISNLRHLTYFSFAYNTLSGPFPASFTNLTKLVSLYGAYNELQGEIPVRIGDLRRLVNLDLQGNSLTGAIPSSIGSITTLRFLQLSNNNLSGTLPLEIGRLGSLTYLDLSFNHVNGSIPDGLGNMFALETLYFHQNNFSGSISPNLGLLSLLRNLNLSYNNFSGVVPTNGVLARFSAASFEGNPFLCLGPLVNATCVSPPPPSFAPLPSPLTPPPSMTDGLLNSEGSDSNTWKVVTGVVVGTCALSLFALCVFFVRRSRLKEIVQIQSRLSPDIAASVSNSKLEMYCTGFKLSYEQIVSHAGFYDTAHVVGKGRFATVYRSDLPEGTPMAVKVFRNSIPQLAFEKEVEGLESASHFDTLLPIRGYFSSPGEKAILYDFMPKGNLYDLLHNNPDAHTQLDWSIRLTIAMGIAQGLAHLHKGSSFRVLHKDVKSTNILLDDKMYPLITDFGLIGLVSKSVVETPGYIPPELNTTKKYTEKTDVYSFGVVLLELLTGKKPVSYIGDRQLNLVTWALRLQRDGRGREVFSANLVESCPYPDYPDRALSLAVLCLSELPAHRPTMSEMASILEDLAGLNSPLRSPGVRHDRPLLLGT